MAISLILSDIDGTVLKNDHSLDERLVANAKELAVRQIPFILASARSPLGILPIAEAIGLDSPIAAYNGALIARQTAQGFDIIAEHPIVVGDMKQILRLLTETYPSLSVNLYSGLDWFVEKIDKWVEIEGAITGEKPKLAQLDQIELVHKCLLIDEKERIEEVLSFLQQQGFAATAFYLSKENYLEITHKEVSKRSALRELAKFYQVSLLDTMVIGDNYNDLPMIELAGLGVAMGNAPTDVKEGADVVTASNQENGVSQAIETYVLN